MIIGTKIPSELFSNKNSERSLYAEASDLTGYKFLGHLYDDAADVGFVMVSERTGQEQAFSLSIEKRNDDNEIEYWVFTTLIGGKLYFCKIWND
jgi:hypothetical protein